MIVEKEKCSEMETVLATLWIKRIGKHDFFGNIAWLRKWIDEMENAVVKMMKKDEGE